VGSYVRNIEPTLEREGHYVKVISREEDLKIFSLWKSVLPIRKLVKRLIKKEECEVIYTQDWSLAFPLLFPRPIFRRKHFCCFHGFTPTKFGWLLQKIVGKLMKDNLFVINKNFNEHFPKAIVNYEGVNLRLFKPLKIKRDKIGLANWPTEEYNYEIIEEACKKINEKLLIANNIQYSEMNRFYNKLKVLISLPPSYTGFGLVWLEAMAAGVPIIIGNNAGIGSELPITKVEDFGWSEIKTKEEKINVLIKALKGAKPKDYRKWLEKNKEKFSWKEHVKSLIKSWMK